MAARDLRLHLLLHRHADIPLPAGEAAGLRDATAGRLLLMLPVALVLPDILYYVLARPWFRLGFGLRHLINPFRTLANWGFVECPVVGRTVCARLAGCLAYLGIIQLGARTTAEKCRILRRAHRSRGRTRQRRRPIDWPRGARRGIPARDAAYADGGRIGERLGSGTGSSLEFQDYRWYAPGDDLRHVDWAAYARSELLAVRLYREEVAPRVDLVLDVSRSMAVTDGKLRALWRLCGAAGVRVRVDGCRLARDHHACRRSASARPARGHRTRPGLQRALSALEGAHLPLRRRSLRLVVSDFLFPHDPDALVRRLARDGASLAIVQLRSATKPSPALKAADG